jgi:hypothetical protein
MRDEGMMDEGMMDEGMMDERLLALVHYEPEGETHRVSQPIAGG